MKDVGGGEKRKSGSFLLSSDFDFDFDFIMSAFFFLCLHALEGRAALGWRQRDREREREREARDDFVIEDEKKDVTPLFFLIVLNCFSLHFNTPRTRGSKSRGLSGKGHGKRANAEQKKGRSELHKSYLEKVKPASSSFSFLPFLPLSPFPRPISTMIDLSALDLVHRVLAEQKGRIGVPILVVGVAQSGFGVHRLAREELELLHLGKKELDRVLRLGLELGRLVFRKLLDHARQPRLDVAHQRLLVVGGLLDEAERLDDVDDLPRSLATGRLIGVGALGRGVGADVDVDVADLLPLFIVFICF